MGMNTRISVGIWAQNSFYNCIWLLKSGFFRIPNVPEEDGLVKRLWNLVKNAANRTNTLSRQSCGRKIDYLFVPKGQVELDCGECALVGGVNTTKELYDTAFKMPKVMKDMTYNIISKAPNMKHELVVITGFYIGEDPLKLFVLDCSSKYVTRYDGFNAVSFPTEQAQITRCMSVILKVVMGGRLIMENTRQKLSNDTSDINPGKVNIVDTIPCFVPHITNPKKRRISQASTSSRFQ
ncbi:hypothetical protein HMPREF1544_08988 [Mucor circinelloides 1006PhL]|uniref:Uncharacterized protein n=1 Tax=Mucor circinelloides f. circinelloides (strain 1006PhL) TaxID=1220926 RepID=S2JNS3_MUCC1|nr:hypothetical protein HMPREF1544_08988 [Mucor circinelloides 1006PhL]